LVANPAACAEGISLHTVCHHAIYIDRNYNAAQYLQSEDRIHRLGLPPDVITTIEILFTPDTIDESVKRRLNFKVKKMAEILDDNSLNIEVVEPDLDVEGLTEDDINDFLMHLKGE
jgi:SNF2 family DNA or RNA helicase